MYAIIKTGGKQYKVAESDTIEIERLAGDAGDAISFGDVLVVSGENGVTLGSPLVAGAQVAGEIVRHSRSATILVFKKRRRQNSKRSRGHRQEHTVVRITEILTDGKKAKVEAKAKAAPATVEAPADKPKRAAPKAAAPKRAAPKAAAKKADDAAKPARKPRAAKPKAPKADKE